MSNLARFPAARVAAPGPWSPPRRRPRPRPRSAPAPGVSTPAMGELWALTMGNYGLSMGLTYGFWMNWINWVLNELG